ncbi:Receptor-like protein kinase THESEUS 1 [Nymphaea thermarum]|nr:Receptor-like protein kinase THESEUS 1 [Nymphaea thermarum]
MAALGLILRLLLCTLCVPSLASFSPVDNLLIDCGGNKSLRLEDGRTFKPDLELPSVLVSPISHIVVSNNASLPLGIYNTARIFKKKTVYTFSIKEEGWHLLRLHFSPVENTKYELKSAVFSVLAGGFILLHDFSYKMSAQNRSTLMKEFAVSVGTSDFLLTIHPSEESVAFINGIEVISTPDALFPSSVLPVSGGPPVKISSSIAFEMAYRINVGGPSLSSKTDALWRTWEIDHPFLLNPAAAHHISTSPDSIKYPPEVLEATAPSLVYATAEEMADSNVGVRRFNVSWMFGVEQGFSYLVRLHFCDIISKSLNSLVFNVYIGKRPALRSFNIGSKARSLSTAYYVDFVVNISDSDKLLVQIGPPDMSSVFPNAVLNGLEIMKLSDSDKSLDGSFSAVAASMRVGKKKKMMLLIIASFLGGSTLLCLIVAAVYFLCIRPPSKQGNESTWLSLPAHLANSETKVSIVSTKSRAGSYASPAPSVGLNQILTFSEIKEATDNFDEDLILGIGGFGKVYKGVLANGTVVAVKRGNPRSQQGFLEFRTEIEMLSKLRHRHLVSLIGYCEELSEMILVYEFMAGGPLRKHLYGSELPPLSWKQRLEICIGAAKGLHYLHTGAMEVVIHRDVKTTNILVDENLTAKVADFGLSKAGPTLDQTHVSTAVKGSFGYLDPEYFRRQRLTEKSDVYSFGVVLMEVLCARPAINPALPRDQVNIAEWSMYWQRKGQIEHIIDPRLKGSVDPSSLRKFGETAEKCLAEHGVERPAMGKVLQNLELALQLQESFQKVYVTEFNASTKPTAKHLLHVSPSDPEKNVTASDEGNSEGTSTSSVFSQLMNPKGR